MNELEDDIRSTADSIRRDTATLSRIEHEKSVLAPDDRGVADLAQEAVTVAAEIQRQTRIERELVAEVQSSERQPETHTPSR